MEEEEAEEEDEEEGWTSSCPLTLLSHYFLSWFFGGNPTGDGWSVGRRGLCVCVSGHLFVCVGVLLCVCVCIK